MIDFMSLEYTITDEVLAAYIDGNATPEECAMIQSAMGSNDLLSELVEVVNDFYTYNNTIEWGAMDDSIDTKATDIPLSFHDGDFIAATMNNEPLNLDMDNTQFDSSTEPGLGEFGTDDIFDLSLQT